MKTLEQFKVEDNSLSGTIPAEYGNMATVVSARLGGGSTCASSKSNKKQWQQQALLRVGTQT